MTARFSRVSATVDGPRRRTEQDGWSGPPRSSEDPDLAELLDLSDEKVWADSNPAKDIRIRTETIAEQYDRDKSLDKQDFARERCSVWPNRRPEQEISHNDVELPKWNASADAAASLGALPVLAVALGGRGGGYATIAAASRAGHRIFVETLDTRVQTLWVPAALKALVDSLGPPVLVVLDEKNCAPILTDLTAAGIKYMAVNAGEVAGAFGLMVESINQSLVVHRGQDDLYQSLKNATTRPLVGGHTWDQSDPPGNLSRRSSPSPCALGREEVRIQPGERRSVITGIR